MSTTIFGKAAILFSVSNDEFTAAHWAEIGILLRQKKKCNDLCSRDKPNEKSMSTTAQTYWQSSAEIWEGQRNYSLRNEVDKDAISCFSIRKDWRFAVRAKSFPLHWRSRGFFRGHVRSFEKGLCTATRHHKNWWVPGDYYCFDYINVWWLLSTSSVIFHFFLPSRFAFFSHASNAGRVSFRAVRSNVYRVKKL